ncbi:hypothetical protein EUX98_g5696 [Antrodiella citrinella]|uniref:DUF6534 domain-containing protein n=1 Tax=Antrodiella citrinella TaxID=2447956 RepID=A0A4S4MSZ6_9APHY|nr:hypothetical protein EUX98_g5696 [Antrodiella citrinella]
MAALPTIQELLGGHVIGTISALVLYGIFLAQTYVYAMNCGNDPLYLKLCVMCMAYAIDDFGNPLGISHIIWSVSLSFVTYRKSQVMAFRSFGASVICQILIFVIVQSLYIRRIYILSDGNRVLTLTLPRKLLTLFVLLVDAFTSAGLLFTYDLWAVFRVSRDFYSVVGGLALASLLDLVIAITLIYYLWRNKTGFRRTDSIVHVLMAYCVNSGLLTMYGIPSLSPISQY